MIEIKDIQSAVGKKLKDNGYSVIASEVKEGFPKPSCFIEVMPVNVAVENQFYEMITDSVEISYFPVVETKEELVSTAEHFKDVFLNTPLKVNDRYISITEINFDTDKSTLLAYFEVEFFQERNIETEEYPKAEILSESVVKEGYGTSENTN